jgi:RNA polymerase sigma factor (sigma-70 family)
MEKIRVLIVDDHPVVHQGIKMLIGTEPTIQIVGEARDGKSAVQQVKRLKPDIILMDLVMPQGSGIVAIAQIRRDYPAIKIIVLTTFEDDDLIDAAMAAGADGYLLKDADGEALLQAIQAAHRSEIPLHPRVARYLFRGRKEQAVSKDVDELTEREKEVLELVAQGLSNKEVAQRLNLSEGSVKVYVSRILDKLQVSTRTGAAIQAIQMGLISMNAEA